MLDLDTLRERAILLLNQNRIDDAAKEARQMLGQDPENGMAFGLLSVCSIVKNDFPAALTYAQKGVASEPDNPMLLMFLARAQFVNKQIVAAKNTIAQGLQLAPFHSPFWDLRGDIAMHEEKWEEALDAAEKGLAIDPDEVDLINLRSRALIQLKRTDEAAETIEFALHEEPENPQSHTMSGFVKLHQGDYDGAVESFRQALRFNPNHEGAKAGLKEAIKGKNWLYRGLLRFNLWMSRLDSNMRWMVLIGLYLASRFFSRLSDSEGWVGVISGWMVILYLVFAFYTWIGGPLSNLALRLHPLGKWALDDDERRASNWVGGTLLLGLLLLLSSTFISEESSSWLAYYLGMGSLMMMIPVSGIFHAGEGTQGRLILTLFAAGIAAFGLLGVFVYPALLTGFFVGIFVYSFTVNYFASMDRKVFR